jgi:TonB family protein
MKTTRKQLALLLTTVLACTAIALSNSTSLQASAQSPALVEADQLNQKAVSLYGQGKYDEALVLAQRVLTLREQTLGPDHESVARALHNIAEILFAKRKYKEADSTYQRALTIYERLFGADDPRLVPELEKYICFLINSNQRQRAVDVEKRLYRIENRVEFDGTGDSKNLAAAGIMIGKAVNAVEPTYSPQARQAGISGAVVMKIEVDEEGKVVHVKTLCGHSLLTKGAEQAVLRSRFKPTISSGQPKKVTGIIIYNFITG